jgi:hypothetical protein
VADEARGVRRPGRADVVAGCGPSSGC